MTHTTHLSTNEARQAEERPAQKRILARSVFLIAIGVAVGVTFAVAAF